MSGTEEELSDVRRVLRETTEHARRTEMELELAKRQATDLAAKLSATELALSRLRSPSVVDMAVFGCDECGGDHRAVGATELIAPKVLAVIPGDGRLVTYRRAFVCPSAVRVVLVSDESEETMAFHG